MSQNSFDDMLRTIDQPNDKDSADDVPLPAAELDSFDENQAEGVFVRSQEDWVEIDDPRRRKIVFRFKWKK